jgi:hypothetical protein
LATTSATLSFVDERQFLIVIQQVLPLHECADHAPAEFAADPLHSITDSAATRRLLLTLLLLSLFIPLLTLLVLVLL